MGIGRVARLTAAATVVGLLVAACSITVGSTSGIDKSALEKQIREQDGGGATVDCPSGISAEAGKTFICTGTYPDGAVYEFGIRLTDADGRWEGTAKTLTVGSGTTAADAILPALVSQNPDLPGLAASTLECPATFRFEGDVGEVTCTITDADGTSSTVVAVFDTDGNFEAEILEP